MRSEAKSITGDGILRSSNKAIGPSYLKKFRISHIKDLLQEYCPTSIRVLLSIAGVDDTRATLVDAPVLAQNVALFCMVMLLRELSQQNNLIQVIFGLYMYTVGLKRQAFEVLSHVGLTISYSLLVSGLGVRASWKRQRKRKSAKQDKDSKQQKEKQKANSPTSGPLKTLSTASIQELRDVTSAGEPIGLVFDHVSLAVNVAEPVLGKIDTLLNGTCATAFKLHGATEEALDQEKAHTSFLAAPPLKQEDILLSPHERKLHRELMIHAILRILITHTGSPLAHYAPIINASQPNTEDVIEVHQSQTYPMRAMEIDESSIDGTIDVMNTLYADAGIDPTSPEAKKRVQLVAGDHKSVANLRAAQESRAGHDNPEYSFCNVVFIIGLFHALMTAVSGFLILHFGRATSGVHNPGSLHFHNRLLERKPIPINSPIHHTTAKNLINVSLIARVIHCLTLDSGHASLKDYAEYLSELDVKDDPKLKSKRANEKDLDTSWNQLVTDATKLYEKFTSVRTVDQLRTARKFAKPGESKGDMVYEDALLFMRDMLNLYELQTGVKQGDPGRVLIILKVFTLSFRGAGRTQYAQEMLHIIHNVEEIWPIPLRNLVLQNWLLDTTNRPNAWLGIDLHQEHGNLFIKTVHKAHGSNSSWSWLAVISPCTEALRALVKDLNGMLGTYLGSKHTTPNIAPDIEKIIDSLDKHKVYSLQPGRTYEGQDEPTKDAESVGFHLLFDAKSSSLSQYNKSFKTTQAAYKRPVVSEMVAHTSLPRRPPPAPSQDTGSNLSQPAETIESGTSSRPEDTSIEDEAHEGSSVEEEELGGLGSEDESSGRDEGEEQETLLDSDIDGEEPEDQDSEGADQFGEDEDDD
ncbi:hypothetical protein FRC09_006271 [Ceratobasidium sp. 395]|nr:hypothetical protein FRC09_006271 [Ceratobasidium sp. 395]